MKRFFKIILGFFGAIFLIGLIGSIVDPVDRSVTTSASPEAAVATPAQVPAVTAAPPAAASLEGLAFRVTEKNDVFWRHAWKFTLKNPTNRPTTNRIDIEFLDKDGFVVDTATEYNASVAPGDARDFSGQALIKAETAPTVAQMRVKY